ncbi:beclin 1 [Fusarium proliferatum]|uniref:Beclin 1 n=1 Tax=Gibberella intermedia TaxID=948311 RepID=A0A365MUR3_GIBIN|nr:beclin 1 [Fusarium proliferatum]KAG4286939.1 beclin 1 [Fusarium proliferatum]KAG4293929.1 beclin 1 [Fusarium proliferatum]RBA12256.1 beclin 1 [Fusarium proliferatum]
MNCQKCRQPLRLDGSLEDLNPAAYDVLVSSTSPQTLKKSTVTSPPITQPQEQARKSLYETVSRNTGPPTFKRNHGGHPRDSSMSFVLLSESQMTHPSQPTESPAMPTPLRRASSARSNGDNVDAPVGNEMDRVNRLFEILSARSDIDHPICVECTEMLVEGLQKKLEVASRERDAYVKHLKEAKANKPSEEDMKAQEEALRKAEQDRATAMEELKKLESEKTSLDEELVALEEESRQLDKEEEKFWRERNEFATKMGEFQAEKDSINAKYSNDSQLLEKLQRSNVYNDTFCISHDGSFATINGLRLGRLSNKPVDWPEINAAWGHALLLLVTVADKLSYRFDGYDPQPMGSTSRIIRYEVPSPSSSRIGSRAVNAPPKKHVLELYSSGDMPLGLTFMHRRFDNAMVGFLELVRQLGGLPYKIDGDKIGDVSIKLGIAQDDGWTKACKLTLTCSKLLKAALLAYKEVVYDIHVTRISHDKDNGTLVLTHKPNRIERHPFPSHLTSIEEHKQAALLVNQCTMSISLLGPMARGLLAGIVSRMDVAVVEIQNPPLTIKFHPHDGIVADRKFHTIVEATLDSSEERWLIDVTGCQYGFRDILLPLEKYIAQNNCSSYELLQPYGHTETTDQDELPRSPLIILTRGPSEQQLADIEIEKGYRRHFAALVRAIVNQGLTQGPDAQFAVTLDELVRRVITYMSSYQPQTGAYQESPTY